MNNHIVSGQLCIAGLFFVIMYSWGNTLVTGSMVSIMNASYSAYVVTVIGKSQPGLLFGSLSSLTSLATVLIALLSSQLIQYNPSLPLLLFGGLLLFTSLIFSGCFFVFAFLAPKEKH